MEFPLGTCASKVGSEDLSQIAPLSHEYQRVPKTGDAPKARSLRYCCDLDLLVLCGVQALAPDQHRAEQEEDRDDRFDWTARQQCQ